MPYSSARDDESFMLQALRLARRGYGMTSPNPMVGAILVKSGRIIGRGWHRRAGEPHAEIEAFNDARLKGHRISGASLYVTLEPCSTQGRTPPCTEAIIQARIRCAIIGATDPNPKHRGRGFQILREAGMQVTTGVRAKECEELNEAFNHWILRRTPFVTVKAAMTLDGKIATALGESKWITGQAARDYGMQLRLGTDAMLVGINTVLADDPSLTARSVVARGNVGKKLRRIVLDTHARTPLRAKMVTDHHAPLTTIVVGRSAPKNRVAALAKRVEVVVAPTNCEDPPTPSASSSKQKRVGPHRELIDLAWLLRRLGEENITSLLVEGGGEINASFLMAGFAQRVVFFYAPKILGGRDALRAVAGAGARTLDETVSLTQLEWRKVGCDWMLTAKVEK